jgi:hypothetical protein
MTAFAELSQPFPAKDVEWRIQKKSKDGRKALVIAYHDARTVMDVLDRAVGPSNWQDSYRAGASGGVICRLEVRFDGEWIAKEDGAENTNVEAIKGGISDAFKRAGVKWGIGRYLYDVPATWVNLKNEYGDFDPPRLPPWALPSGDTSQARTQAGEPVDTETGEIPLPPMDAPPAAAKVASGVPDWWPEYRKLKLDKRVTDGAVEAVIGSGPTVATVSAYLESHPDVNFAQLIRLAEAKQGELMGATRG